MVLRRLPVLRTGEAAERQPIRVSFWPKLGSFRSSCRATGVLTFPGPVPTVTTPTFVPAFMLREISSPLPFTDSSIFSPAQPFALRSPVATSGVWPPNPSSTYPTTSPFFTTVADVTAFCASRISLRLLFSDITRLS